MRGNIAYCIDIADFRRLVEPRAECKDVRSVPVEGKAVVIALLLFAALSVGAVRDGYVVHRRGFDAPFGVMVEIPLLQNRRIVIHPYIVAVFQHLGLACAVLVLEFQLRLVGVRIAVRLTHRNWQDAIAGGAVIKSVLLKESRGEPVAVILLVIACGEGAGQVVGGNILLKAHDPRILLKAHDPRGAGIRGVRP